MTRRTLLQPFNPLGLRPPALGAWRTDDMRYPMNAQEAAYANRWKGDEGAKDPALLEQALRATRRGA